MFEVDFGLHGEGVGDGRPGAGVAGVGVGAGFEEESEGFEGACGRCMMERSIALMVAMMNRGRVARMGEQKGDQSGGCWAGCCDRELWIVRDRGAMAVVGRVTHCVHTSPIRPWDAARTS